jgi:hypothetical protein
MNKRFLSVLAGLLLAAHATPVQAMFGHAEHAAMQARQIDDVQFYLQQLMDSCARIERVHNQINNPGQFIEQAPLPRVDLFFGEGRDDAIVVKNALASLRDIFTRITAVAATYDFHPEIASMFHRAHASAQRVLAEEQTLSTLREAIDTIDQFGGIVENRGESILNPRPQFVPRLLQRVVPSAYAVQHSAPAPALPQRFSAQPPHGHHDSDVAAIEAQFAQLARDEALARQLAGETSEGSESDQDAALIAQWEAEDAAARAAAEREAGDAAYARRLQAGEE